MRSRSIGDLARSTSLPLRFGLLAAALTSIGIWIPSASQDEGATASAVERSLPELAQMALTTVDAVHGFYYAIAHIWTLAFGADLVSLRLFSVLGVAVAAAGTVRAAELIRDRSLAVLTGFAFLTVPMVTWTASEARSYAWVIAATAWATAALLRALRDGGRWWLAYSAIAALASVLFIYSALVIGCQFAAVLLLARDRVARLQGSVACVVALAAAAPVAWLGFHQRAQVDWIGPFRIDMLQAAALQWFGDSQPYATIAWSLVVAAIGWAVVQLRKNRRGTADRRTAVLALAVVVPWILVPTTLLLAATAAGRPSYVPRYGAVSVAGVAILFALAGSFLFRRAWIPIALLAALCIPTFVAQRLPLANGDDWATSAQVVEQWTRPGTAFYFAKTGATTDPRAMLPSYRQSFEGLDDMALWTTAAKSATLIDSVAPAADAIKQSHAPRRVIVIADNVAPWWNSSDQGAFNAAGYTAVQSAKGPTTTVFVLERR